MKESVENRKPSEKSGALPPTQKKRMKMKQAARQVISNYFKHDVGRNSAALAYYLLFALFPLLIFVSNLLGLLNLDVTSVSRLRLILPLDIVNLLETYLEYVSHNSSQALLWFSLVFTICFPLRATKGLMDAVRTAYQLEKPKYVILYSIRQLICTLMLLVVLILTLLFSTLGQRVLTYLMQLLPFMEDLPVPQHLIRLWHYFRFLLLALIMFATLAVLYAMSQDHWLPVVAILPGAVAALLAWLAVSVGFSFYVDHFANYSVIYGTLGAVMVLLIWLYMTSVILILGAEFNAALQAVRRRKN